MEMGKIPANPPARRRTSAQRRTAKISLSLTPDEKQRVIDAADATGRLLFEFVREELLQSVSEVEKKQAGG